MARDDTGSWPRARPPKPWTSFVIRPGCLAGAAWLARPLPGGAWLGFAVGKAAADLAWYAMEASARGGGVARSLAVGPARYPVPTRSSYRAGHRQLPGTGRRAAGGDSALRRQGQPSSRGCWAACTRPDADSRLPPGRRSGHHAGPAGTRRRCYSPIPVKPAADIARAWKAGVWRFAADSDTELDKIARNAPGSAILLRDRDRRRGARSAMRASWGSRPHRRPG